MDYIMDKQDQGPEALPTHLPPTPDSPLKATILPHVREHLSPLPLTPPSPADTASDICCPSPPLLAGLNMLHQTSLAVSTLHTLYATSPEAQAAFQKTVNLATESLTKAKGKIQVCGVGKSAKIGAKFVATCTSLRVRSTFLHAGEAMHGDLGSIEEGDVLLLITYSAKTEELLRMMAHVPSSVPVVVMTAWQAADGNQNQCPLFLRRSGAQNVVLPAPIPVSEEEAFGVRAPTTSTTVALALCDALALAIAGEVHGGGSAVEDVFRECHPGGAIGKATAGN